jgi:hypothetical protein
VVTSLRAVLLCLSAAAASALPADAPRLALPFLEDDYPKAMEQARSKKLPVFVEAWAPW